MLFTRSALCSSLSFFFSHDTATPEIYTLSLHDALPISVAITPDSRIVPEPGPLRPEPVASVPDTRSRSEEHTSELQSLRHLVCRLLLEKKKKKTTQTQLPLVM